MSYDLGTIIAALHDSEINGQVSRFWHVKVGDEIGGFVAEAVVPNPGEAAEWLRTNAVRPHPASRFGKRFGCSGMTMAWYIEMANKSRSQGYDTLEQAKTALPYWRSRRARMDPRFSEPVKFVSSDGQEIEIPPDDAG